MTERDRNTKKGKDWVEGEAGKEREKEGESVCRVDGQAKDADTVVGGAWQCGKRQAASV